MMLPKSFVTPNPSDSEDESDLPPRKRLYARDQLNFQDTLTPPPEHNQLPTYFDNQHKDFNTELNQRFNEYVNGLQQEEKLSAETSQFCSPVSPPPCQQQQQQRASVIMHARSDGTTSTLQAIDELKVFSDKTEVNLLRRYKYKIGKNQDKHFDTDSSSQESFSSDNFSLLPLPSPITISEPTITVPFKKSPIRNTTPKPVTPSSLPTLAPKLPHSIYITTGPNTIFQNGIVILKPTQIPQIVSVVHNNQHQASVPPAPQERRRVFKCTYENCSKNYFKSSHLKAHIRIHSKFTLTREIYLLNDFITGKFFPPIYSW